jgi:hypothetical protein
MQLPHPDGPERLGDVLSRLFLSRGLGQQHDRLRLEAAWRDSLGEPRAARTRLGNLRRGVLEVIVADAVLHQELAGFEKRRILTQLQQTLGKTRVTELRFRLGSIT